MFFANIVVRICVLYSKHRCRCHRGTRNVPVPSESMNVKSFPRLKMFREWVISSIAWALIRRDLTRPVKYLRVVVRWLSITSRQVTSPDVHLTSNRASVPLP